VLHGVVGFDEAAEAFHYLRTVEEFAEEFDFFAEFLVGDGLDEFLGGDTGFGVELGDLLGHRAGDFKRVAFACEMRDEAGLVSGFGFVAYPAIYGSTGVTTFIVNQNGIVYQKDLGSGTEKIANAMTEYDPDSSWQRVD